MAPAILAEETNLAEETKILSQRPNGDQIILHNLYNKTVRFEIGIRGGVTARISNSHGEHKIPLNDNVTNIREAYTKAGLRMPYVGPTWAHQKYKDLKDLAYKLRLIRT